MLNILQFQFFGLSVNVKNRLENIVFLIVCFVLIVMRLAHIQRRAILSILRFYFSKSNSNCETSPFIGIVI